MKFFMLVLLTFLGGLTSSGCDSRENMTEPKEFSINTPVDTVQLSVHDTMQLTVTWISRTTWQSSDNAVVTVTSAGLVRARAEGIAKVLAKSTAGKRRLWLFRVISAPVTPVSGAAVATVEVSPASSTITPGQTLQLSAIAKDANGNVLNDRLVTWSSSNAGVATVSASGLVTGTAAGTTTITATSEGKNGVGTMTVAASSSDAFGPSQRPYGPGSPWNTPIPVNPAIEPTSDAMVAGILRSSDGKLRSDPTQYAYPVYFADASTPRVTMICTGVISVHYADGTRAIDADDQLPNVPIPPSAQPSNGTDAQIIVIDTQTGDEYDIWRFAQPGRCENMTRYARGVYRDATEPGYVSRGAGVPYLAGLIRPWEIAQGRIDHALAFVYTLTRATRCVYPASKTDGDDGIAEAIPQGARLQLDPALDVNTIPGLSPAGRVIARALQEYGAYVIDTGGSNKLVVEDSKTAFWGTTLTATTVSAIPVDRIRVLKLPDTYWAPTYSPNWGKCVR